MVEDSAIPSPFDSLLEQIDKQRLPPVSTWNPDRVGEIEIKIRRDGVWLHEGREIQRIAIARVFSTILRKETGGHFLVTPVEKLKIEVEDTPFVVVDMENQLDGRDQEILLKTSLGDVVPLDNDHKMEVSYLEGQLHPIVRVRDELYARVLSSVYARFVDLVEETDNGDLRLWSFGSVFDVY